MINQIDKNRFRVGYWEDYNSNGKIYRKTYFI